MKTKTNEQWEKEGHGWHFDFHNGLGYRICEEKEQFIALAKIMKRILKEDYDEIKSREEIDK